ncbi:Translocation protein SEC63-like protein [Dirofilaria immitis]|nr:Translocation protein SEC63-like protein [Dirofilaria immitis]
MGRAQFEYDEVGNTFYYVLVSFYALVLIPATFFSGLQDISLVDIIFIIIRKVTQIEVEHTEYDPYAILGIDQGAASSVVKKKYRELSKTMHPDKGGDPVQFDRIAKAYQALTDEESRENWEKYGNPDGPTATTFGIALPKWIVSKEYGIWVLAFYGFVLMVLLPSAVGFWWYNSIKYSIDQELGIIYVMNRILLGILMVLGGSFEFWKQYNKEIVERESDDVELPPLIKQFKNLSENKKERPLCLPYSLKARFFIHAHLSRFPLCSTNLKNDSAYVISKCVMLTNEMLSIAQHLCFYGNPARCPSLDTIENMAKLLPMIVQALWPKINRIITCADLANLNENKRRQVLQLLSDAEYNDVIFVLQSMPRLNIEPRFEVQGEIDAQKVTVGSVVTLKVILTRNPLLDSNKREAEIREISEKDVAVEVIEDEDEANEEKDNNVPKRKIWEKPKKKQNKTKQNKNRQGQKTKVAKKFVIKSEEDNKVKLEEQKKDRKENNDDMETIDGSENEELSGSEKGDKDENERENSSSSEGMDEDESDNENWANENMKLRKLVVPAVHCTTLVDEQTKLHSASRLRSEAYNILPQVEIKFAAPQHKGIYYYNLLVKSDSYTDCDYLLDLKLDVHEAKEVPIIKYEDSDEEEQLEDSSDYTEDSESEHE